MTTKTASKINNHKALTKKIVNQIWLALLLFFGVFFVAIYIKHEEPLYYWDYAGYWDQYKFYGSLLLQSFPTFSHQLFSTIRVSSYSGAPVAPLMLFFEFFGGSRLSYIEAISTTYLLPTVILLSSIIYFVNYYSKNKKSLFYLSIIIAVLYTPFWVPTLRGYISIGGLIPLALALILLFRTKYLTQSSILQSITIGFLLWSMFLFRRWYAPTVVAIILTSSFYSFLYCYRRKDLITIRKTVLNYLALALSGMAFGAIFQGQLLLRIISTNYSNKYLAYSLPFTEILTNIYHYIGPFYLFIFLIGLAKAIKKYEKENIFFFISSVITLVVFSKIQAPGQQQLLPIMFLFFPLYFNGIVFFYNLKKYTFIVFFVIAFILFLNSFLPNGIAAFGKYDYLFPQRSPPLKIQNYTNYVNLDKKIQELVGKNYRFSVFAASTIVNSSLLVALDNNLSKKINWEADIDNRDHFFFKTLSSKFIVVATPIQLQFNKKYQRAIYIPAQDILKHKNIGKDYEMIGHPYNLADGVIAKIYKQKKPLSPLQVHKFEEQFLKYYPDWLEYFNSTISPEIGTAHVSLGNKWGSFFATGKKEIEITPGTPGEKSETSAIISTKYGYKPNALLVSIPKSALYHCPDTHGSFVTVSSGKKIYFSRPIVPGSKFNISINPKENSLRISAKPIINSHCDWVYVKFMK